MPKNKSRREFITEAGAAAAALTTFAKTAPAQSHSSGARSPRPSISNSNGRVIGANDRINVGFVGCGGRMKTHIDYLARRSKEKGDTQMIAVCDIYDKRKQQARER